MAVTCGMIRDHPGMLRLVGLYCALYRFLYGGGKRQREDDIMWEKEKCFAGQLSKKCPIHYFPPFRAQRRSQERRVTAAVWVKPAGQWPLSRGHCGKGEGEEGGALLESYIQLKPGPDFSLETGDGLCYIQGSDQRQWRGGGGYKDQKVPVHGQCGEEIQVLTPFPLKAENPAKHK